MANDDYKVGYGKPPDHTKFKKGQTGNVNGRPKKKKQVPPEPGDNSEAEILGRLDSELIDFNGGKITAREAEIRVLRAKALKGDIRAAQILDRKRKEANVDKPLNLPPALVVPGMVPIDQWEAAAARQQAPFREAGYSPSWAKEDEDGEK